MTDEEILKILHAHRYLYTSDHKRSVITCSCGNWLSQWKPTVNPKGRLQAMRGFHLHCVAMLDKDLSA